MKRRRRIARVLRLVHVTKALVPFVVHVGKSVATAYVQAWRGPKPRPRVVHVTIRADATRFRRDVMTAAEALERMAASHRALRRVSVSMPTPRRK